MLTINKLTVSYGRHKVISDLDVSMDDGKIYGVVGYNGAGKTTLLNAIYGIPKQHQCISYNGVSLNRSDIAYLDTDVFFYSRITGRDYLKLFQRTNTSFNYEAIASIFNIPLDNYVDSYSTGTKKKLALAGIISMNKQIIMLDEPYNSLDLESVSTLQIILKRIAGQKKTIIITSHIMETLSPICNSIFLLEEGRITKEYLPEEYYTLSEKLRSDVEAKFANSIDQTFHS